MDTVKPQNMQEYRQWLVSEHKLDDIRRYGNNYDSVALKVLNDFEMSDLWTDLRSKLLDINNEYYANSNYQLFVEAGSPAPQLDRKSFDSFLNKTFRRNVLENINWPKPPEGGWLLPDNWFPRISDMVRTLFVVKYLDGVEYLASRIQALCDEHVLGCEVEFQAREEGYYAAHIGIAQEFEIPTLTFDTYRSCIPIEIQITTQLQDVIRRLLHKHYDERRVKIRPDDVKWQWDYKCEEFSTNYLGHILHYVEGMIMEIREGDDGRRTNK